MSNCKKLVEEYLFRQDWRVNANANQGYSYGGMVLHIAGNIIANYWLDHVYPEEISSAHREGDFHIHDLDFLGGYCAGWSLRDLLNEGFGGVPGKVESGPPKHFSSALGQIVNFFGTLQNEWAGAQAFSSFDTLLAPYVREDNLDYNEVKQSIQEFIYNLNVPSRWGGQTPFTNLTFDLTPPPDLKYQHPLVHGEWKRYRYVDLQPEIDMINRAFLEVMRDGDNKGRIFTFPIPTYNINPDFDWDGEVSKLLFEVTAKYGLPYFQNFLNSDLEPGMVRSMCCRLQLDLHELRKRGNGLFGSGEQTGSIGVVTINCARLGIRFRGDRNALYRELDRLLELSSDSLEIKRRKINELMNMGLFPYTGRYLRTLRNHFSTIGVNGINEMILNFTDGEQDISTITGKRMAVEFLDHIRNKILEFQERTGNLYNLEATPAESATYRFVKEDLKRWGDRVYHAGTKENPYYTNSSQLPVNWSSDLFSCLEHQEELQRKYNGGTVFHVYLGEKVDSWIGCKKLVKRILENYRIPYLTITPTFSICPKHGYLNGVHEFCPICDREIGYSHLKGETSNETR